MDSYKYLDLIEKQLKTLELSKESITKKDIEQLNNRYINLVKNDSSVEEVSKEEIESRIANLSASLDKENNAIVSDTMSETIESVVKAGEVSEPIAEKEAVVEPNTETASRSYKMSKKTVLAITGVMLATALATAGCKGCSTKEVTAIETQDENNNDDIPVINSEIVQKEEIKKVLSENLAFDPNDNEELVNRMIDFIADSLGKGVPVKDVMTEEEIALASKNDESLITIEQLMNYYIVMNIEDIDPMDFARLCYNTKTAETITDDYMYVARVFMTDALTMDVANQIDYTGIIADKDSAAQVQKMINYISNYNDGRATKEEIRDYIISEYINKDANLYSMSANEFTYRLMFVVDMISNNGIIPQDVNIILNEDGKISCDIEKEDGVKDKTEKAEEFTSIYNTVKEKLEISREYTNQDLTNVSDYEKKTGVELEKDIKDGVLVLNVSYKANKKFSQPVVSSNSASSKAQTAYVSGVSPSTGETVNVSASEMAKYGATTIAEYEQAKKAEFAAIAQADPNHTIKNNEGQVVVSGNQVDTAQYNSGYSAGYYAGNNKQASNPGSSNASYVAGYNEGYKKGKADREALDASYQNQSSNIFVPTNETVVTQTEVVTEQPYTTEVVPTPAPTPQPAVEQPTNPTQITEFEPVNDGGSEETTVTYEEHDYVSSLKDFKAMLLAAIDNSKNVEEENIKSLRA